MHDSDLQGRGHRLVPANFSAALYSWYGMTPREPIYMLTGQATDGIAGAAGGSERTPAINGG